jgi:hypothetical protein
VPDPQLMKGCSVRSSGVEQSLIGLGLGTKNPGSWPGFFALMTIHDQPLIRMSTESNKMNATKSLLSAIIMATSLLACGQGKTANSNSNNFMKKTPLPENFGTIMRRVPTIAPLVIRRCSTRLQNLNPARAGQAFGSPLRNRPSRWEQITVMVWFEMKLFAADVVGTSGTFLMTGQSQPVFGIA